MKTKIVATIMCLLFAGFLAVGCAAPQETKSEKPASENSGSKNNNNGGSIVEPDDESEYEGHLQVSFGEVIWYDDEIAIVLEQDTSGPYEWDFYSSDDELLSFVESDYVYGDDVYDELRGSYDGIYQALFLGMDEGLVTLYFYEYNTDDTSSVYGEVTLEIYLDEFGYIYEVSEVF